MPIYEYGCPSCGRSEDAFRKIAESDNGPECCGAVMNRKISPVRGIVQGECHYVCPATGKQVGSWRERRNIMAETGLADVRDLKGSDTIARMKRERREREELAKGLDIPGVDMQKTIEPFNSRQNLL